MGDGIDKGWAWAARVGMALLFGGAPPVVAGDLDSPGCLAGGTTTAVIAIDEALDLRLADGRTVHLPGIAVPDAPVAARQDLAGWLTRVPVAIVPLRTEPDRWGRVVALAFAAPPGEPERSVSVTEALIEAGRALARPEAALEPCWAGALRLEREAERQRRGLWAGTPVLKADDTAGLTAQAGRFAIVAGQLASVHDGRARLYLRFASDGGTGMAVTLGRTLVQRLTKAGTDPRLWVGRHIRVRGMLDDRWGWQIEVTDLRQIELDAP